MRCAVFLRLLALLALSACSAGGMGGGGDSGIGPNGTAAERRTDLETQQACRDRTNEM